MLFFFGCFMRCFAPEDENEIGYSSFKQSVVHTKNDASNFNIKQCHTQEWTQLLYKNNINILDLMHNKVKIWANTLLDCDQIVKETGLLSVSDKNP